MADRCIWHGCGTNLNQRKSSTMGPPTDQARMSFAVPPSASATLSGVSPTRPSDDSRLVTMNRGPQPGSLGICGRVAGRICGPVPGVCRLPAGLTQPLRPERDQASKAMSRVQDLFVLFRGSPALAWSCCLIWLLFDPSLESYWFKGATSTALERGLVPACHGTPKHCFLPHSCSTF